MKIKKFNETLKGNWNSTDKIVKVSITDEFPLNAIMQTTAYQRNYDHYFDKNPNSTEVNAIKDSIYYGIEEYIFTNGSNVKYELVDSEDNPVNLEIDRDIEKYNL